MSETIGEDFEIHVTCAYGKLDVTNGNPVAIVCDPLFTMDIENPQDTYVYTLHNTRYIKVYDALSLSPLQVFEIEFKDRVPLYVSLNDIYFLEPVYNWDTSEYIFDTGYSDEEISGQESLFVIVSV